MIIDEKKRNAESNVLVDDTRYHIEINKVPIYWDSKKGNLTFFGIDSALFWTDPSIINMFAPITEEVGKDLFRLLVAYSSSLGTEQDFTAMISTLADNFSDGFLAWGRAVSVAGWGSFELPEYNPDEKTAVVIVRNSWEIIAQHNLVPEKRWGAPFMQGKLIGIFSQAFGVPCWANDISYYESENPYTEIRIFPSDLTIENEIKILRYNKMLENEKKLSSRVEQKTAELQQAKAEIEQYSISLEEKIAERTTELMNSNQQLQKEIETRIEAERKLEQVNHQLREMSISDKLTEIGNRRCFDATLAKEWSRAKRTGWKLALIFGDIDWFKSYNDTYGHQSGDECLRLAAKALKKNAKRESDLVSRYGGEEFAVLLPVISLQEAIAYSERLIQSVRELKLPHAGSKYGYVTISFGIAVIAPKADQNMDELLKAADVALYSAKENGRNQCALWDSEKEGGADVFLDI